MNYPSVILDRDGVLNPTVVCNGRTRAPKCVAEFRLFDGVADAVERLAERFKVVVVTNQPGIARGIEEQSEVERIHDLLRRTLPILDVLTCGHDDAARCDCRKPHPGLFLEAARRFNLDLGRSFTVGDHWVDIAAGNAAGCRASILILTPSSECDRCAPDCVVANLPEAARWILDQPMKS